MAVDRRSLKEAEAEAAEATEVANAAEDTDLEAEIGKQSPISQVKIFDVGQNFAQVKVFVVGQNF
jgi:hypothetical protein